MELKDFISDVGYLFLITTGVIVLYKGLGWLFSLV